MKKLPLMCAIAVLVSTNAFASDIVKVPCRDMGDSRTLIDGSYLPDWINQYKFNYDVIEKRPTAMKDDWANNVCTIKIWNTSANGE